ncbi:MAG TPA: bifunctional 5,10-methylenetetrahydrofolate dehydrogenase/5,10-methenyltetrahydrofolate cyclohydrolase [Candidatus Saccharibacteria bacterium]|nr:bifunctional 5,10-methylenetetrahydrofolate dehydrogenase/5,10-methenyltetrahydrofolate cyclohydrolase [Candidatus Saccharibacteria bacterium]
MKLLLGSELADYIKERQLRQARNLRQEHGAKPTLAIVQTSDNPVIGTYVRMKQQYGEDIEIEVRRHEVQSEDLLSTIEALNNDVSVHGIIVQLPLADESQTQEAVDLVAPEKDVDGLGARAQLTPATAMAIDWLLAGFNVDLKGKKIGIVGNGRLVGGPLAKLWKATGYDVTVFDEHSKNMAKQLRRCNVIVSAAGVPGLITSMFVQPGAVVVDAATSSEHGKILGDVADEVRDRNDLTITPDKGGVGPLTVAALFDNVLRATRKQVVGD